LFAQVAQLAVRQRPGLVGGGSGSSFFLLCFLLYSFFGSAVLRDDALTGCSVICVIILIDDGTIFALCGVFAGCI